MPEFAATPPLPPPPAAPPRPARGPGRGGPRSRGPGYAVAVAGTGALLLPQLLFIRQVAGGEPLLLFLIPVLVAAWAGGARAGLLAAALGGAAGTLVLLHPAHAGALTRTEAAVWVALFLAVGALASLLSESLHRAARVRAEYGQAERQAVEQGEMEQRWMQLLRANVIGIAVGDYDGTVVDANDVLLRLLGRTHAELRQGTVRWRDLTPPEHVQASEDAIAACAAEGVSPVYEKEFLNARGERVPMLVRLVEAPDDSRRLIAYMVDLSRQRQAEGALRQNEARQRLLLDAVRDYSIVTLSPDGTITSWNRGAEHVNGYAAEQVLGRHISLLYPPEEPAGRVEREMAEALAQGRLESEGWRVRRDGSRYWANVTVTPMRDEGGALLGFAKITRDLSGRRRSEVLLQSLLDNVLDAIIGIDDRGIIQSFNRAAERIFGFAEAEVRGRNVSMLMPDPDRSGHDRYLRNYLTTGDAKIIGVGRQVTAQRSDGSHFPADLAVSEFTLDGRRYFTGVIRDVTAQRRLEDQLRQAQKMEAVGRLAGGVAHDFNNLLTVIGGFSAFLRQELPPGTEAHQMVGAIAQAGEQAARLTRQLLAFSRQAVLEPRVISLNEVVRETESILQRVIGEDVRLETRLDADTPAVLADPGQVSQVLMNLAVNARDAMPRGGHLSLTTASVVLGAEQVRTLELEAGLFAQLSVSDTGHGMTEQVRARAFEPFFTTKGPGEGTGLGLATVYGIVRQSGGHVDIYSEPGIGTTIKIYLPAVGRPARDRDPEEEPVAGGTETILLVEDDHRVRGVACAALVSFGYTVLSASSGERALEVLDERQGRVDLLLTDVVMPGMSGRELAEAAQPRYPALRVLYVSGYTDDAVVRHGLLHAEVCFLQKPYTPRSLARRVRQVLDEPRPRPRPA